MSTEQLPYGLQLAVDLLYDAWSREVIAFRSEVEDEIFGAMNAIRAEHAQRVTLQHHAADLAQRVADLEAERDEWKQNARNVMDADLVQRAALEQERELRELRARLAEAEAQEPACWAVIDPTGEGGVEYTAAWKEACHEHIGNMITEADMPEAAGFLVRPLFTRPVQAQAAPDGWRLVLTEARDLFAAYAESHRARGPEHAEKAARNEAMATKINAALAANGLEVRRG